MFYTSPKIKIMAILNVTPDSFSDGGRLTSVDTVLRAAEHAFAPHVQYACSSGQCVFGGP